MTIIKKIIPLIRQMYPNLLAQQITSVQPMTSPTGAAFTMSRLDDKSVSYHEWVPMQLLDGPSASSRRVLIIYENASGWGRPYPRAAFSNILTSYAVFLYAKDTRRFVCTKDRAGLKHPGTYLEELKIPVSLIDEELKIPVSIIADVSGHYQLEDSPAGMLAAMKYGL